jgi:hypothetical protein
VSSKFDGGIVAGSTSVSLLAQLKATTTGAAQTGVAFGSVTAYYLRQGGTPVAISLSALGSINAAFSAGGWYEADAAHMPGLYRIDIPDAAWAAGVDWVEISVFVTAGGQVYAERLAIVIGNAYDYLAAPVETIAAGSLGTLNWVGIMRLLIAKLLGLANGGGTSVINYRDQANAKNRITETEDQNGNRTSVVVDGT